MNIKNKLIIILIFTISYLHTNNAQAQQPDHTFNYQGELIDNGVPANGSYDIIVDAYDMETAGAQLGSTSQHLGITVQNGLFNLTNVNVSDIPYDGGEVWLNIAVRPAGGGGFTNLAPRQLLQAVPYASKLANGFATQGQVYTFDNTFGWRPQSLPTPTWNVIGGNLRQNNSGIRNVGIGVGAGDNTTELEVNSSTGENGLKVKINNSTKLWVQSNGGTAIGSFNTSPPVDGLNVMGDTELTGTSPVNTSNGGLSVGNTAGSHMTIDGDDIQRRTNGSNDPGTMFLNFYGGDVRIASSTNKAVINGDLKQPIDQNGVMKYMVHAFCSNTASSIIKSFNGVNTGTISIASGVTNGRCTITFPESIANRYLQVTPMNSTPGRGANCSIFSADLVCSRYNPSTLSGVSGEIMILVY